MQQAGPFGPRRILFQHKSKLSLSTLICFNDPNTPIPISPSMVECPFLRLCVCTQNVIEIYYKLISYFISALAHFLWVESCECCCRWNYEKAFLWPHTLFTMMMSAMEDTDFVLVFVLHSTSHWAKSDILNLMEIDERLLWYEIAALSTLLSSSVSVLRPDSVSAFASVSASARVASATRLGQPHFFFHF